MATTPGVLSDWPWEKLGNFKYLLYLPFAVRAVQANWLGGHDADNWCLHVLIAAGLRYLQGQLWMTASRSHALAAKYRIQTKGTNFEQVDRESSWEDNILLHALVTSAVRSILPGFKYLPFWDTKGFIILILMHMGPAEFVYYWAHRALHHHYLYNRYHSHHHMSFVTEPVTGTVHPFAEHLLYYVIFAIPILGAWALGHAFVGMIYVYWIGFDFFNAMGHCNFEFVPIWVFQAFPFLKYLIYTPSYHSLHHTQVHTNFALFMPLYDYLSGTADKSSDSLHVAMRQGRNDKPDFVFLVHALDLLSLFHIPHGFPSFAAHPYAPKWYLLPLWPLTATLMLVMWLFGNTFVVNEYNLDKRRMQTWTLPRYAFQYSLPFEKKRINRLIERAILDADKEGVKVICIAALNKNENLNESGTLFVKKHPNLKIRIAHGDTLAAAAIIHQIPKDVREVFLTGATSNIGRAIGLSLCTQGVRVLMLTSSKARFEKIRTEATEEHRNLLIQATKYEDGKDCKHWVVGKAASKTDQSWAPSGTHFYQFVVPSIPGVRKDCTYGRPAAMRLPKDVKGIRTCEMTMPRGVVHACHAGGAVHALEGWDHHEVGAVDISRIVVTWEAALKHGFTPA